MTVAIFRSAATKDLALTSMTVETYAAKVPAVPAECWAAVLESFMAVFSPLTATTSTMATTPGGPGAHHEAPAHLASAGTTVLAMRDAQVPFTAEYLAPTSLAVDVATWRHPRPSRAALQPTGCAVAMTFVRGCRQGHAPFPVAPAAAPDDTHGRGCWADRLSGAWAQTCRLPLGIRNSLPAGLSSEGPECRGAWNRDVRIHHDVRGGHGCGPVGQGYLQADVATGV
jgi:hypothetical protein